ncbi:potassium voltage-gated channel subfamily H member 8 isoform X2 [Neocloeon triangulifer]|uniref:potassium voltage-gated channel subfamily H member 8 isoform X2 n=1 Tax=Neocloeon triangulifer TaxID=2078957 RepID=UPI00286F48D5|nr:potassium voltage-gated channel subfamily H member 8 isoform X2 [Neocloeon triangulifer]
MPGRKGLLAPQNTFLDTIATRFDGTHSNFVLGNAQVPTHSHPIVYCSDGFCELTGWARAQIMQKSCACKFLWGADTNEEHREAIENSLLDKQELKIEVIFYKKNGSPFWCQLDIVPIKNEKREVVLFLASHKDITSTKMAEMQGGTSVPGLMPGALNSPEEDDDEMPSANHMGRRRSRAVLYQLSGHYKHQDKVKPKIKISSSLLTHNPAPLPEYKSSSVKRSRFIFSHYGLLKGVWDWLVVIATVYVAIAVPFLAAFVQKDVERDSRNLLPDITVESLFIGDIILNFRTTYVNKKGEVVSSPRSIALNYLKGWFAVDLLAAIPFDLLYASDVYTAESSHAQQINLLKLTRLLRLLRVLQKMDRYSQYSAMILTLLMLSFSLVAHWMACIWYVIAERERKFHEPDWNLGWLSQLAGRQKVAVEMLSQWDCYVTALYFTCSSLTSVGFGNVSANTLPEKVFSVCIMLIGALMHAVVFGNVTAIIQRLYSRRSLYQARWTDLKDFLALAQVPKDLKQRIEDYFQTSWSVSNGIDINEILKEFPEELRGDVSMHLHREVLQLPIFQQAPQGCLKLLSLHIKSTFCAPGEYMVHKGDALNSLYYLCHGSMEVQHHGMVVAILGTGDLVGCDIPLEGTTVGVAKSSGAVKALTYCDLKNINMAGLVEVLRLYPEFQQEFCNDILHDLTYNLREGYEAEQDECEDYELNRAPSLTLPSISEADESQVADEESSPLQLSQELKSNNNNTRSPKARSLLAMSKGSVGLTGSPGITSRNRSGVVMCGNGVPARGSPSTLKRVVEDPLQEEEEEEEKPAEETPKKSQHSSPTATSPAEKADDEKVERLHMDVTLLSIEVRSALQALNLLARPYVPGGLGLPLKLSSNPNLTDPSSLSGNAAPLLAPNLLTRSHSQPAEQFWSEDETNKKQARSTQTEQSQMESLRTLILANPDLAAQILKEAQKKKHRKSDSDCHLKSY